MASVQPARQPLEVAMDFIKRINSGNVEEICELMTPGHIFQDARLRGQSALAQTYGGTAALSAIAANS